MSEGGGIDPHIINLHTSIETMSRTVQSIAIDVAVMKAQFTLVRNTVFGMVTLMILTILTALLRSVIKEVGN